MSIFCQIHYSQSVSENLPQRKRFGKPMDLCAREREDHEYGMGAGANSTLLSDTPQSMGLEEFVAGRAKFGFEKKPMDLCVCESEEYEPGVGTGVNTTLLSPVRYTVRYTIPSWSWNWNT